MSPESQRIAIATAAGRCPHTEIEKWSIEDGNDYDWGFTCKKCGSDPHTDSERLPEYDRDLNAIQSAVRKWADDSEKKFAYHRALSEVVSKGSPHFPGYDVWDAENATAAQRSEAFLKCLNLWQPAHAGEGT